MATTTESYGPAAPANGFSGLERGTRVRYVADESNLGVVNDIVKYFPIAIGTAVVDAWMELGDFDTNATPICTHSLILNNGTEYELAKDATIGRAGGFVRAGATASDELTPLGVAITASGAYVGIKTTAAAATAATSGRKVVIGIHLVDET